MQTKPMFQRIYFLQKLAILGVIMVTSLLTFGESKLAPASAIQTSGLRATNSVKSDLETAPQNHKHSPSLVMRRQWEPRQKAFTVLVPEGWIVEGGLFYVDPTQAGGAGNSLDTKCDLTVKRDTAGTVLARWMPSYNYADFSASPEFVMMGSLFPIGRAYNGCQVKPLPAAGGYLQELFRHIHNGASEVKILEQMEIPELVHICDQLTRQVNQQLALLGKSPIKFTASALVVEYQENGIRYREALVTALSDMRQAAALWSNQFTFLMRAPSAEADQWKPILDIIRQSIQLNPEWVQAYIQRSGERGQIAAETFRYLARIDQEIYENRSKTRSNIQHENYLLLTGQEEYLNPYTKEIERDSADYKYRWTTASGDRFYTDQETLDPNLQKELNQREWKRTVVRPRE